MNEQFRVTRELPEHDIVGPDIIRAVDTFGFRAHSALLPIALAYLQLLFLMRHEYARDEPPRRVQETSFRIRNRSRRNLALSGIQHLLYRSTRCGRWRTMTVQATSPLIDRLGDMNFAQRLAVVRKQRGMTQQRLSDLVGVHVTQMIGRVRYASRALPTTRWRFYRYEAGTSQLTLEVLRALAVGLSVSTDALVFNEDERGPADDQLRLHLEALNQLDDDENATVVNLIESILLRHQARRLARSS